MKWLLIVLPLVLFGGYARPPAAKEKTKAPSSSADSLLLDLARPTPQPLRMVSSTDPKGGNEDYVTLKPKQTAEFAKLTGPVTVVRLWFTGAPVEELSVSAVMDGKSIPLRKQGKFAGLPKQPELGEAHEKSYYSYAPLGVKKTFKLIATNHGAKEAKFFYQVNYREGSLVTVSGKSALASGSSTSQFSAGSTMGWGKISGDGMLESITLILNTNDVNRLNRLRLLIRTSNRRTPQFEASLGALAATYYSTGSWDSRLIVVRSSSRQTEFVIRFPAPFNDGIEYKLDGKLEVAGTLTVTSLSGGEVPPYRLCAKEVTLRSQKGKYLELLDVKGEGNLVGVTLGIAGTSQQKFAMLEGDEHIEVDDDPKLTLHGTGTEDFFNSSWYFPDKPFSRPFHGLTHKSTPPAKVSCYRWLVTDRIPFKKHLKFLFEHGGRNNTEGVEYRAVVFWYQRP